MKCIYCLQNKRTEDFNREHVVPRAFGAFDNNLVLHQIVCRECNSLFGNTIDKALSRYSFEAVERYRTKLKSADRLEELSYQNIELTYSGEGPWAGVRFCYYDENEELVLDLIPQVGIWFSGDAKRSFITLPELKSMSDEQTRPLKSEAQILIFVKADEEFEEIKTELERLGTKYEHRGKLETLQLDESFSGEASFIYTFSTDIRRAVCKICFNYLASAHGKDLALSDDFNAMRSFIRHGCEPEYRYFSASNHPILRYDTSDVRQTDSHMITLDLESSTLTVFAQLSFFNTITYRVVLAPQYSGLIFYGFRTGHSFDWANRLVNRLGSTRLILPG
jgi:hypothetical protein